MVFSERSFIQTIVDFDSQGICYLGLMKSLETNLFGNPQKKQENQVYFRSMVSSLDKCCGKE